MVVVAVYNANGRGRTATVQGYGQAMLVAALLCRLLGLPAPQWGGGRVLGAVAVGRVSWYAACPGAAPGYYCALHPHAPGVV